MVSIDSFDERQFARCPRCNGVVAKTDLAIDGVCRACKTRRGSSWEMAEENRMERAERESQRVRIVCPVCKREHILTENRKRCDCGFMLRK
jgi:ribosomal protein S27AE